MSRMIERRADVAALSGYHSAQIDADVRLNTNEMPEGPPPEWRRRMAAAIESEEFNRYPDREARALREALGKFHGVGVEEIFCANGSNEVLQSVLLAFGGPGRTALVFEPTYLLHSHIARITLTGVAGVPRTTDFEIDLGVAATAIAEIEPAITFLCSPNNPTGRAEPLETIAEVLDLAPGLVIVDEAYGQFARESALALRGEGLIVVRTFSKTWAMAGVRLGYLIADPEIVAACEAVVLPYHLSSMTQLAGLFAVDHRQEMDARVAFTVEERGSLEAALAGMPVETWPSDANFILFRPTGVDGAVVWRELVERGVLIRDCSSWEGLEGCLRVTVGTAEENRRFEGALREILGG